MGSRATPWIRAGAGAASMLALASCSLVLDANAPQCSTTDDCVARGAPFASTTCVDSRCVSAPPITALSDADAAAPAAQEDLSDPWRCAGHVTWPEQAPDPLVDTETFANFANGQAIAGLSVDVCRRPDVECVSPLATVVTNAMGEASLPITNGFAGYLQLKTPPASFPGLMPTILPYIYPAGVDRSMKNQLCGGCVPVTIATTSVLVASKSNVAALVAVASATLEPSRGLILAYVGDCDNQIAKGVQLEVEQADERSSRYYFQDGLPNTAAKETTEGGLAGFVNVPPGVVSITSKLASTGQVIGTRTVLVRAGTLTVFFFPPTPL
jgi:hypothetical protein